MKHLLCLLFAIALTGPPMRAQTQALPPQFFDNSNAGTEFYLTFLPALPVSGGRNNIRLYVASAVETEVTVEVRNNGFRQKKTTTPNSVIEFTLAVTDAQAYFKTERDPTPKEDIYRMAAVTVTAKDPVVVYGVTRYQYSSDGFLALPVSALGREYIIASFFDVGDNGTSFGQYMPSEAGVVAAFDSTKVSFTLGGNLVTTTPGGMKPGDVKTLVLNKGDVLSLASFGHMADLSGSKITSSKPVAVFSGNFCAYVPDAATGYCDHLVEAEIPTYAWGKDYVVTKIFGRLKNAPVKIMAKEPNTKIFRNGQHIATIQNAGGVDGIGYISRRIDEGAANNFVISADKPICVTQFNSGQDDDGVSSDPFQLVLTPTDHFLHDVIFSTPGTGDGSGFARNYVNLVFELDEQRKMPAGLEVAEVNNREFVWKSVAEQYGSFFESLATDIDEKAYGVKTIKLPVDGVYRFRSTGKLAAYSYGFSDYDGYGFPAGALFNDLNTPIPDTIPPVPVFKQRGNGNVEDATVSDGNVEASRLASITFMNQLSFNYNFQFTPFIPGEALTTEWSATVIDKKHPAKAVIMFIDRAGNDTTITLEYDGVETSVGEDAAPVVALTGLSPNPASDQATITYSLAAAGHVRLALYNELGVEVQVLVDAFQQPGVKTTTVRTGHLPAGVYLCRLTSGGVTVSDRLLVVK